MAGTVGAACLPLAFLFWQRNRKIAVLGLFAASTMVVTSRSSGPLMTTAFVVLALILWKVKESMQAIRVAVVLAIVALAVAMNEPVYYIMAKIDFTGKS